MSDYQSGSSNLVTWSGAHTMANSGTILEINLTTGIAEKKSLASDDAQQFIGGRGLGVKLLWDRIPAAGLDPLSPENPLLFVPGACSGFPLPSAARSCVVTKSPHTSPLSSAYPHASTLCYANMGGFFGSEIRFAGYEAIIITGKASVPVYILIDDDRVEIREAQKFWGMGTDEFDRAFIDELGDRRFRTCYIGPAGENLVTYACIIHTASRAAGRGGAGCVMGSKNLKAIAVRGSGMPGVADHKGFLSLLDEARGLFKGPIGPRAFGKFGTAGFIVPASLAGLQTVKNYREGTFARISSLGGLASKYKIWVRNYGCYCCPIACHKSGVGRLGPYAGQVHDGPEYEPGVMLGPNLMVADLKGMLKGIRSGDDYGFDLISAGNAIGFLMEAYEKGLVDINDLDGIDLAWGNVDAVLQMLEKIAAREGFGDMASRGVKALAQQIGKGSEEFAIHIKGLELAGWTIQAFPGMAISYATSNRGACHMNGMTVKSQNTNALVDSLGICAFAAGGYKNGLLPRLLTAITGVELSEADCQQAGERIFNLEKMFNLREGFGLQDDGLPSRFFDEPQSKGIQKNKTLDRDSFKELLDAYYTERGWDTATTRPSTATLERLALAFAS